MRVKWAMFVLMVCVALAVAVTACAAAQERPTERVSPAPEVNSNAVVWRTPEPPTDPQAGDVWVNPRAGMEMVYVAAGEFTLGSGDVARPQCRVNLPAYWIGRTEVTNAQYLRFVQATGHRAPHHWVNGRPPAGLESFPVVYVSWEEDRAYCAWAGGRLPTELEWEKAARGIDGRIFPWGNEWDRAKCRNFQSIIGRSYASNSRRWSAGAAWCRAHDPIREGPAAVGSYPAGASPYGCQDMAGNVSEWCEDWYDENAYRRYATGDLTPTASGSQKVLRGGSWSLVVPQCFRCAYRYFYHPGDRYFSTCFGFRCVRDAAPPAQAEGGASVGLAAAVTAYAAAQERPTERVSPAPEVNLNAVVWRTSEPPASPQAGDAWVNPRDGMMLVYVAAGQFILGTSDAEIEAWLREHPTDEHSWFEDEQPQCRVTLPAYWIGRTEVTNAQYLRFVQATGQRAPQHWASGRPPAGLENFPVVHVSWADARAYCEWAGGRLPTELEWEKAARGTDGRIFPWGNEWDRNRCRNFEAVSGRSYASVIERVTAIQVWLRDHNVVREGAAAVGSYPSGASPYGCQDMAGNVFEWCEDWYDPDAYRRYATGDLTLPTDGDDKVLRGDSWSCRDPADCRCVRRYSSRPDNRDYVNFGFRYVRGLP